MEKKYVIESKGFTQGLGSSTYFKKRKEKLEQLKIEIAEINKKIKEV